MLLKIRTLGIIFIGLMMVNCRTEEGNEKLADAGQKVGTSAATMVKSMKAGIEKVSKINLEVSENLKTRGVEIGKVTLGSKGGRHNMLSVYVIFDKKINKNVMIKITNSQGIEVGRTSSLISGNAGEAKYIDFVFDKRTNIDRDHKIEMI